MKNYKPPFTQPPSLTWFSCALAALGLAAAPLRAQPTIITPPASQMVVSSFTAPFGITAIGATGYQWFFNGQPIGGATNPTFYVLNAQPSNAGPYYVQVNGTSAFSSSGTVFLTVTNLSFLAPSLQFSSLASLNSTVTGASPQVGVMQAGDGYLYGVTAVGGTNSAPGSTNGTIFKMSTNGALVWAVGFNSANGSSPIGGLVQAGDGNLYGTTAYGGTSGYGTVFRVTTGGVISSLYSFQNLTSDGGHPEGTLCVGSDGYLYGTTSANDTAQAGGSIFKISTNGGPLIWSYQLTVATGDVPLAGLVQGLDGGLYGTTSYGGATSNGVVFRITTNNVETFSLLYSFTNGVDGSAPLAGLVQGRDGQLYGTTSSGGIFEAGTIFKISTNGGATLTVLASFDGTNGDNAEASLVQGSDGNFYGTTTSAGLEYPLAFDSHGAGIYEPFFGNPVGYGTIFQLTTNGTLTTLYSFNGGDKGNAPHSSLWPGSDGGLYGTTSQGGTNDLASFGTQFGDGTVFRLGVTAPSIQSARVQNGSFSFTWNAAPNVPYQAQYKDALTQPAWMNLGGLVTGTNGLAGQSDAVTNKTRFYRVARPF